MEKDTATKQDNAQGAMEEAVARIDPEDVVGAVAAFARENPHTALAAAAGIGFVLGGGLTPRLLGAIGVFAARQFLREAMRDALQGAVAGQIEGRA
jgi:hypothetical protein